VIHSAADLSDSRQSRISSLHIDTRPDWRGGQSQVLLTVQGLCARGHEAELMALSGGALEQRARAAGLRVHAIPAWLVRAGAAWQVRRLLVGNRFDVIHAHDPHALTAAWLAGAHRGAALVAHKRVATFLNRDRISIARYRAARRIFAISRFVAERIVASGIDPAQVEILYEGVELPAPTTLEQRREARRRWSVRDDEVLLGCVGYFVADKGQETLLSALPAVLARFPNARLLFAGDGPRRPALEKLARDLGVAPRVIFAGFVDDIAQVYRAIDLFLWPSLNEGLGTSLLVALAHALPVVSVESGAAPEIVEDGRNGFLFPPSHAEECARAVVRLLEDSLLMARLAAAARQTIAQKFTADRMVENTIERYKRILAEMRR
jgi:glycosyltransferase involved in cell wall biosynthesis